MPTPRPKTDSPRTLEAIEKLRSYYELGQEAINRGQEVEGTYARGVIAELAEEHHEGKQTVQKCRQMAEMYTQKDLESLCKLRTPQGKPIGWGHVTKLLTVPDRGERKRLQNLAAKEGWTVLRLDEEIKNVYETTGGGRRHKAATSKQEALRQINSRCQQWLSWYEDFATSEAISLADLPEDVRKRLQSATRAVRKLQDELPNDS